MQSLGVARSLSKYRDVLCLGGAVVGAFAIPRTGELRSATPRQSQVGGGGSWSTRVVEISNDLSDSKRRISKIGQRALVQVQNRYSPTDRFGWSLAAATTSSSTAYSPFVVTAAFMGSKDPGILSSDLDAFRTRLSKPRRASRTASQYPRTRAVSSTSVWAYLATVTNRRSSRHHAPSR